MTTPPDKTATKLDIQSPILVIGAGRSGSTLLHRVLNKHPEIAFFNENNFLAARLWLELWQDRFWLDLEIFNDTHPSSALDPKPVSDPEMLQQQKARIGRLVAETVAKVHGVNSDQCRVWGYKEIWSGAYGHDYPWDFYDAIYPRAYWLHLVRNPFNCALSNTNWNREPLTLEFLEERLHHWVLMAIKNSRNSTVERYCEIRYEDLVNDPQSVVRPLLEANGLAWNDACLEPLKRVEMKSVQQKVEPRDAPYDRAVLTELVKKIDGLVQWMERFDYAIPEDFEQLVVAPQPNFKRAEYADLSLIKNEQPATASALHYHIPHRMLKQITLELKTRSDQLDHSIATCTEWEESNKKSQQIIAHLDKTVKEWGERWEAMSADRAEQMREWQEEKQQLNNQNKKLFQDYLNERARHVIYYFCIRHYNQFRALLKKMAR